MPTPQEREAALFALALEKPIAEREAFLQAVCGEDSAPRQRLEALLAAHEQPNALLTTEAEGDRPTLQLDPADMPDDAVGMTLGRYKLLERVGEGGCGVVYVAEQTQPVRRRVALKVIKLGMDTREVIARFEAERQALAMMDHPNIARVLDAGTTEMGRPYFVMELVRGIRITDYCDQANLSTKERLDLFIKVCQAIQHAHQKGIIHRDIKPSNILVTLHDGVPVPKVIDFGIAKATEGRLTDATVYTQLQQFIGTPAYMSPEQAEMSGLDIDTRSDIYSLGVLLYELLAGSTPFDANELMASGIDAMRKTIREKEPVRPSTRFATLQGEELTTTARRRSADTSKLLHQLKGDLDWIVMKCLEKDRTRRYETANGLAADLKRHLSNEPVVARPPSTVYKFQKAFRRNKLIFVAGMAVLAALVAGLGLAALGLREAVKERNGARVAQAGEETQRRQAEQAQANEARLRHQAEAQELAARRRAYASDMNAAQQAIASSHYGRAWDLLNRQRPSAGELDLRGWEWRYLWQLCRSDAKHEFPPRTNGVMVLALSHNGRWLASAENGNGPVSIWDMESRRPISFPTTRTQPKALAFAPNRALLAYQDAPAGGRPSLCLWDVTLKRIVQRIPLNATSCGISFSADGNILAIAEESPSGRLRIWDTVRGTNIVEVASSFFGGQHSPPVVLAADASFVIHAGGSNPRMISLVELPSGKVRWQREGFGDEVSALALSKDGKTIASVAAFMESPLQLWDAQSGEPRGQLVGHRAWISVLEFLPDGKTLVAASADQTIRFWNLESMTQCGILLGHRHEVWSLAVAPDGKSLVTGGKDGSIMHWDVPPFFDRPRGRFDAPEVGIGFWAFSGDDSAIVAISQESRIIEWRWDSPDPPRSLFEVPSAYDLCVSADGARMAVGSTKGHVTLFDLAESRQVKVLGSLPGNVAPIGFLSDDRLLVADYGGDRVCEWNIATGEEIRSWVTGPWMKPWSNDKKRSAWLSRDHRWLSCVESDQFLLVDLQTGEAKSGVLPISAANSGVVSPDAACVIISSSAGFTKVLNRESFTEKQTLRGHRLGHHSAICAPDGSRIVTGSGGRDAIKFWDAVSAEELITFEGVGSHYWQTAFSHGGNVLAGSSMKGSLHVWSAPSWEEITAAEAKD